MTTKAKTMTMTTSAVYREPPSLYQVINERLTFSFHKYQKRAMRARQRFILLLAGTQGGKTSFAPAWLHREIQRCGPGDYLFVAPTYKLMNLKAIPELVRLFAKTLGLGELKKADGVFLFSAEGEIKTFGAKQETQTRILFGHAGDPDSLESATAKAAVLDECGQKKFKLASFEAIMRRLSLFMGRVLMTTTPYYLGWLKKKFFDPWKAAGGTRNCHSEVEVIRFPSTANPAFPQAEFERAKRDLPDWKFKMFYRAIFTKPAGLIYDVFDEVKHVVKEWEIGRKMRRYIGLDFGGVNTAALRVAEVRSADGKQREYVVYGEYHTGGRTAEGHATALLDDKLAPQHKRKPTAYGGAKSEDQWRLEFTKGGLPVHRPPVSDVEVGINRVYKAFKTGVLKIHARCKGLLDELASYSRELDDAGEPTEKIEDKSIYHLLDALRYIMSFLIRDDEGVLLW